MVQCVTGPAARLGAERCRFLSWMCAVACWNCSAGCLALSPMGDRVRALIILRPLSWRWPPRRSLPG